MRLIRRHVLKAIGAGIALRTASETPAPAALRGSTRLVVLDVGGTIIQDRGDVVACLQAAFSAQQINISAAEINGWRGAAKREVVQHFVDARTRLPAPDRRQLSETIYTDFVARIIEAYKSAQPIEGAEAAFRKMRALGLLLATSTGFDREITDSIFHRLKWTDHFAAVVTSDDVTRGRPSPYMLFHAMETARVDRVSEVVAVGDTPLDLQAGANAGVRGIVGVLSGVGTARTLAGEPHTDIIASVADLAALLESRY